MTRVRRLASGLLGRRAALVGLLVVALGVLALVNTTRAVRSQPLATGDDLEGKRIRAQATFDPSKALYRDASLAPTSVPRPRFLSPDGLVRIPAWDDREISPERKRADPWPDPFWPRWVSCMQGHGLGLDVSPEAARQEDIDAIVAEVNVTGPFRALPPRGDYKRTPELQAFAACEGILFGPRPRTFPPGVTPIPSAP